MKNLSLNKHLKFALTFSVLLSMVALIIAGCAEHRESDWNEALFWEANRTVNGIGVLFAIVGWGFWEFFVSAKKQRAIAGYVGILFTIAAMIMINGYVGIIGGSIAIALQISIFVIIAMKTKLDLTIKLPKFKGGSK